LRRSRRGCNDGAGAVAAVTGFLAGREDIHDHWLTRAQFAVAVVMAGSALRTPGHDEFRARKTAMHEKDIHGGVDPLGGERFPVDDQDSGGARFRARNHATGHLHRRLRDLLSPAQVLDLL
jgi:hypothetical protein